MYAVERLGSYITRGVYTVSGPFHPFGGAVDIIVVEQPDGSFKSSPWYVRFGKFQGVLKAREKIVTISVNGIDTNFHMILDQRGEAYFLRELEGEGESICFSSSSSDEMEDQSQESRRPMKSKSCNYDGSNNSRDQINASNGKIVGRANSDQSRISGLIFGQGSMENDGLVKAGDGTEAVRISSLERAEIAADLVETFLLDENDLEEKLVEISEISKNIDESNLQVAGQDVDAEDVISEVSCSDSQSVDMFEGCPQKKLVERVSNDIDVLLPRFSASEEENGSHLVQHHRYCQKSESSMLELDISKEQFEETFYIASGGPREIHIRDQTLHVTAERLIEDTVNPQVQGIGLERRHLESHNNSQYKIQSSISGHAEANLEVPVNVSPFTQMVSVDPVLNSLVPVNVSPFTQMVSVDPVLNSLEMESMAIGSMSGFSNSIDQIQDELRIGNGITRNERQGPLETDSDSEELNGHCGLPVPESSEEEQFFFSDVEDSEPRESLGESGFPDAMSRDNHFSFCPEGININNESYSSRSTIIQNKGSCHFEKLTENSKLTSSPICIPKGHNVASAEVERLAESLPNLWSNANNLDKEDLSSLSHSLDLKYKSLEWNMQHRNGTPFTNSETGKDNLLVQGHSKDKDTLPLEDMHGGLSNLSVEISLCKHLLHEGMGAEAASQAFDAEKLDLDKFTSLGPAILKNDRLVVRIGGRYFPWDAAGPIVLGMAAFGSENILEPKDMIAVDRVEKSHVGDASETIVTTSGSWRLWPFPFRRSRSRKATPPALHNTRSPNSENVLEGNAGVDANKNVINGKVSKKMVKAVTPTSEELASLNLKEGSNEVTFTFSTSVLGKQKVDARIFLWKWNTRIVISDVDGTITKSDVLGQFMPLVGIDWSQTGVAHLFSAIKDNGYQFLYLSARAIAQAYITRQFLVNLKQDGKALPDGPVVISPDGLFPSLYREVIRRAPHEFKIACLEDIRALFPPDCNPFYAGFGNRDTDEISYLKVGIPKGKIFIINPKGEVAVNRLVDTRSYTSLHALVHGMFPAMSSSEQEDYNSWNFWKLPPPDIDF